MLLEAAGLRVEYVGGQPVLAGVDLALRPGESVAIVGPSGSGKSSLLSHLAGLRRPEGGVVCFRGRPLADLAPRELDELRAREVGFVFQRAALLPFLTIRENVALALDCLNSKARASLAERVDPILERTGLSPLSRPHASRLSVGEAQRVAVARAVVKDPGLILADEPTGALDTENAAAIVDLLLEERGWRAVVIATHDERVSGRCDRVLALRAGRLT